MRLPRNLFAYCLMPKHFHLVLRPFAEGDLSRSMHWLLTTHVRRCLKHYGHQGSGKPRGEFPVEIAFDLGENTTILAKPPQGEAALNIHGALRCH